MSVFHMPLANQTGLNELASTRSGNRHYLFGDRQWENNKMFAEQQYGYIHYYNMHDESIPTIQGTKDSILQNYLNVYGTRMMQRISSISQSTGLDPQDVEDLLTGSVLDNINPQINEANVSDGDLSLSSAMVHLDDGSRKFDQTANFVDACVDAVESYVGNQDLLNDYVDELLQEYAAYSSASMGELGSKILYSLISDNDGNFFTTFGDARGLPSYIAKAIGAIAALPQSESGGTSSAKNAMAAELEQKWSGWLTDMNGASQMSAEAMAVIGGNQKLAQKLGNIGFDNIDVHSSNGINITTSGQMEDFNIDGYKISDSAAFSEQLQKEMEAATVTRKSGMSEYTLSGNGVSVSIAARELKGRRELKPTSKSWTTRVRHNESLMTIFLNELHYSSDDLVGIYNLAAGHTMDNDMGSVANMADETVYLEQTWQDLIDYCKYTTFLNAVTNLNVPTWAQYIAIDGNVWTTWDFITTVMMGASNDIRMIPTKGSEAGLQRSTYVGLNQWRGSRHNYRMGRDSYQALIRSAEVRPKIHNQFVATRVNINMSIKEVATLMGVRK